MCTCQDWRSYNFHIRSLDQIDFDLIESELSHKNPVMFVEVDGVEGVRVCIHESIWNKANNAGKTKRISRDQQYNYQIKKLLDDLAELQSEQDFDGFVTKDTADKMLKIVRRIKKSRWDEPYRAQVRVRKVDVGV